MSQTEKQGVITAINTTTGAIVASNVSETQNRSSFGGSLTGDGQLEAI